MSTFISSLLPHPLDVGQILSAAGHGQTTTNSVLDLPLVESRDESLEFDLEIEHLVDDSLSSSLDQGTFGLPPIASW